MAQLQTTFDATQVDPTQSAGMLPVGRHNVVIESSEIKPTKSNDGGYLQLNLRVIDGEDEGATGPYRLNIYNSSPKAVEIAHRQLSAICHAVRVYKLSDSGELHNIPFQVEVGLQRGENPQGYTEVKKVFAQDGSEPGQPAQAQPQAQQQPQAQGQQPAWGQPQPQQAPAQPQQARPQWGNQPAQPQQAPTPPWGK